MFPALERVWNFCGEGLCISCFGHCCVPKSAAERPITVAFSKRTRALAAQRRYFWKSTLIYVEVPIVQWMQMEFSALLPHGGMHLFDSRLTAEFHIAQQLETLGVVFNAGDLV